MATAFPLRPNPMQSTAPTNAVATPLPANPSDAAAIISALRRTEGAELFGESDALFAVLPEGKRIQSLKPILDEFLDKPERVVGVATLNDERSFIEHVVQFKNDTTRVFAFSDFPKASFTAVYDYHAVDNGSRGSLPNWQQHRAVWQLQMSKEWLAWNASAGQAMSQQTFAEFLDLRVPDVYWGAEQSEYTKLLISTLDLKLASPSSLIALSRNLAINVETRVKHMQTLSSGEMSLVYDEQHKDGEGQPIKIPNAFLISIPVIRGGPPYQILVRLRYRVAGQKVSWFFDLHRIDVVFDAAINEISARVVEATGCTVFLGAPEK